MQDSGNVRKRLAFTLTSSYERSPMQPRRTPFRVTLDRLTHEFACAVLDAVRAATLVEILGMDDAETHAAPRLATQPPATAARARTPKSGRAPNRVRTAPPRAPEALPPVDEPAMPEGTEIDAQALLASIEAESAPVRNSASERSVSALLEPALPRSTPPKPPPSEPPATSSPALREGEQALRTGKGHVVLRRRRTAESAA